MARESKSKKERKSSYVISDSFHLMPFILMGIGGGITLSGLLIGAFVSPAPATQHVEGEGYNSASIVEVEKVKTIPGDLRFEVEDFLDEHKQADTLMTAYDQDGDAVLLGYSDSTQKVYEIADLDSFYENQFDMNNDN